MALGVVPRQGGPEAAQPRAPFGLDPAQIAQGQCPALADQIAPAQELVREVEVGQAVYSREHLRDHGRSLPDYGRGGRQVKVDLSSPAGGRCIPINLRK